MVSQPVVILVIDNEPSTIDIIQRVARRLFPEATFIGAYSPQHTINCLEARTTPRPHLILLDINLQNVVDGFELLPQIQVLTQHLVPVIIVTLSEAETDVAEAYARGAVAYTRKPADLAGWEAYVRLLRDYWFKLSILPNPEMPDEQAASRCVNQPLP